MAREASYKPIEPIYLTENEYLIFKQLDRPDDTFPETPEAHALIKKLAGRDIRNLKVKPDRRVMRRERDMRSSVYIAPEAPNARYPRATDVSSHPHIVNMSDTGKLYVSDYFKALQNEYDLSFVPLQRRVDMTPLSPIIGQGKALHAIIRTEADIFAGTQLAFQGAIPDVFRNGFVTYSQEYDY
jgi:hypothetical protein